MADRRVSPRQQQQQQQQVALSPISSTTTTTTPWPSIQWPAMSPSTSSQSTLTSLYAHRQQQQSPLRMHDHRPSRKRRNHDDDDDANADDVITAGECDMNTATLTERKSSSSSTTCTTNGHSHISTNTINALDHCEMKAITATESETSRRRCVDVLLLSPTAKMRKLVVADSRHTGAASSLTMPTSSSRAAITSHDHSTSVDAINNDVHNNNNSSTDVHTCIATIDQLTRGIHEALPYTTCSGDVGGAYAYNRVRLRLEELRSTILYHGYRLVNHAIAVAHAHASDESATSTVATTTLAIPSPPPPWHNALAYLHHALDTTLHRLPRFTHNQHNRTRHELCTRLATLYRMVLGEGGAVRVPEDLVPRNADVLAECARVLRSACVSGASASGASASGASASGASSNIGVTTDTQTTESIPTSQDEHDDDPAHMAFEPIVALFKSRLGWLS